MSLTPKQVVAIAERANNDGAQFSAGEVRQLCDTLKAWQHLYADLTRILGAVATQLGLDPVALAEDPSVVLLDRIAARELFDALRTLTDDVDPDKNPTGKLFRTMAAEGNAALAKHAKRVGR
ncbi:MAG: hypothetical protein AAB721_02935 [Patescibacteria group bacterium]